jgi:hypothetical protein
MGRSGRAFWEIQFSHSTSPKSYMRETITTFGKVRTILWESLVI